MASGRALPSMREVELCSACSPIFSIALKYTSAALDNAVRRGEERGGKDLACLPTSPSKQHTGQPPPGTSPMGKGTLFFPICA